MAPTKTVDSHKQASSETGADRTQKRRRKRFPHGNYTGYYTTRYGIAPGSAPDEAPGARDPRINLLQRSWFEGKKCLDVGCNEGYLTLALVRRFRPRRMVGVDIDGYLVQLARKAIAAEVSSAADTARRRAECIPGPTASVGSGALVNNSAFATVGALMPRSLRGSAQDRNAPGKKRSSVVLCGYGKTRGEKRIASSAGGDGCVDGGAAGGAASAGANIRKAKTAEQDEGGMQNAGDRQPHSDSLAHRDKRGCPPPEAAAVEGTSAPPAEGPRAKGGKTEPVHLDSDSMPGVCGEDERPSHDRTELISDETTDATFLSGCAVSFRHEDFMSEPHGDHGYDVICLFSVVKWMHLNGGDEALRGVFRKAYCLLRPGGRLVLEPQPWKSYKKSARQHGSQEARANANTIQLRPSDFSALLTGEVGFSSWEEVGVPGAGVGGFAKRSIHVFVK